MNRRILALLLSLLLLLSVLPAQALAAETEPVTETVADADYDGIPDSVDSNPSSNTFSGSYSSGDFSVALSYTMDYRGFFGDNTVYNEAIAGFSTWAAQFTYENDDNETSYTPGSTLLDSDGSAISKVYHVDQLMRAHGMENVIDYRLEDGYFVDGLSLSAYSDDDITEVYLGHHPVSFNGETIDVIAIFVRGTNGTEKEWCSNFDVGDLNRYDDEYDCLPEKAPRQLNADWVRKSNHRGFDVCSTRVLRALETYINAYVDSDTTPVFWLSGHSRGGAISNIVASRLVDKGEKVFAYTFASPNTTANTEASAAKYDCIFNLVNGNDFVPMLPMPEWGFTRYGRSATVAASSVSSSDRSSLLGNTSYSYSDDLGSLVNKFVSMTKNNAGGNDGWRDVYVYHCCGDGSTDSYHTHPGETVGEYRDGTKKSYFTDSNWNGYNEHTKKYSYCVKDNNGWLNKWSCCQTPAYAMQLLAITMGNLGLSAGWSFLTSYDLADKFDFGKTSLITNYATKIIDPHYMENYYLIQTVLERDGNPETAFSTDSSLYTQNGRPVHEHSYTFIPEDGHEPTCTAEGRGYLVCYCSQINSAWYDDVIKDAVIPALGHDFSYQDNSNGTHTVDCSRCDEEDRTEACTYEYGVCIYCGHHETMVSHTVSVYVVDELDGAGVNAWAWGSAGNLDEAWPGRALNAIGTDKGGHPYYMLQLDTADYDKIIFNRSGQPQTATLNVESGAAGNDYVVYYIYGVSGNDLQASRGDDLWPAPAVTKTEPSCTEPGTTVFVGMFTGEEQPGPAIAALGHDYVATVTPPTETQQGYTTHVCSRCGDTYVDTYVPALGSDYTVHFSVPAGVTQPADMVSNTNTGITLPTVEGPEGYTFLGWVLEDYDNVETMPAAILTGSYIAPSEITLKALFTYTEGGSGVVYELLTATPNNWAGNYVITNDATSASGTYVLKGVNGSTSGTNVENTGNCAALAASGITLDGTTMTNVASDYVMTLAANDSDYTVQSVSTGAYFGMNSSSYLFAYSSINSSYCNWIPAINANGIVQLKNAANGSYPYFSWSTSNNYFWSGSSTNANVLKLYKETQVGTDYYTTIIGEEHVHTPGSPVTENVVEATCTAAGSYDTVVYCTECGEELSRETTTVPALGHNPQAAVVENNAEPSCTVAGGYDSVVYCGRCNAELSRDHVDVDALGHDWSEWSETTAPSCTVDGEETRNCSRCSETETRPVTALGHLPGEAVRENYVEPTATDEGGYDMVVYCQRCNAELSREHTTLPATGPVDPIERTSLRLFRNVSIGTDMLISFSILESNLTEYDSWYIQITKDGPEGAETYRYEPEACNLANDTYSVDFTHITAKEMGVMYHAQVFAVKDGVAYCGPVREGTMKQYLASTLTSTDSSVSATLKTLAADMLNYGAAAQVFLDYDTEHLVNVELSETELTALHNYETTGEASATKTNTNTVPTGEPRLLYTSVAMTNRVELGLFVNLNNLSGWQDAESIEVRMKDHETQQVVAVLPTVLNANGTQMDASFPGIGAKNMRTEYDFVTMVDGVERGNIRTWSIEGYVNQLRNDNSSDALKALANAVLIYGDSAQRYLDSQ